MVQKICCDSFNEYGMFIFQLPFDFTWKMLKDTFNTCGKRSLPVHEEICSLMHLIASWCTAGHMKKCIAKFKLNPVSIGHIMGLYPFLT